MVQRISILQNLTWSNSLNGPWMKLVVRTFVRAVGERANPPLCTCSHTLLTNLWLFFIDSRPNLVGRQLTGRRIQMKLNISWFLKILLKNEEKCFIHFSNEILDGPHNKTFAANRCPDDHQIYAKRVSVSGASGMRTIGIQFASAKENISEAHGRWCCPCPLNRSVTNETDVADSLITAPLCYA